MKVDFLDIFFTPLASAKPLEALKTAIEKNEDKIMDLNREQLDRGLDSAGKSLGKYANFKYKNRFQPVDLKLTGDFRDRFTLAVDDKQTIIFSQDVKDDDLRKRYGNDITGIADRDIERMQEIIEPDFINNFSFQIASKLQTV